MNPAEENCCRTRCFRKRSVSRGSTPPFMSAPGGLQVRRLCQPGANP